MEYEALPHPTAECNFEFWNHCHMEPGKKKKDIHFKINSLWYKELSSYCYVQSKIKNYLTAKCGH